ncbi:hypothetical protein MVEN_00611300 [Mycena venus]|uniref:Novel STAND NTPase 1 domain-containing protein n=1 Tax=Mycena venus TaxID=2733690 RepID=A0A8H7D8D1_9AGAR|nr:hypothetical protein MVEN_00611300 [Mycena venus]
MPLQPNLTDIRWTNIKTRLTPAVTLLNDLHDAFSTPFILAISNSTLALITAVQGVKRNKEECIQLMEDIQGILYAIIQLHIKSETKESLPPAMLHDLGKLAQTLQMIQAFVESGHDGNRIKRFFRQGEINALLKNCRTRLHQAQEVFKHNTGHHILEDMDDLQKKTDAMHRELLELISNTSDGTVSDRSSSILYRLDGPENSSNSFSMLPSKPKIFHGRDTELHEIVSTLYQESARVAILGAGGMGKTSLARAVLHHPQIVSKYEQRVFVGCDSARTGIELAAQIGMHLGLEAEKDLTKPVVEYFSRTGPTLLTLDNLDTSWEPKDSRGAVEELISLLTEIPHLALIITMRGAERPAKVRWTRPFLPPLKPLSDDAARQTFIDIADDFHDSADITQLLNLTDNMPLAVNLVAHLVEYEVCSTILDRWKTEKTSLLSDGRDRKSSLDASINISLSSPRITSCPGALELLSLLSVLPDGISDAELVQSNLPIQDILGCKAALLSTALAYNDDHKRLKSLVPIREHVQYFYPPQAPLLQPLRKHFHLLLDLYRTYQGAHKTTGIVNEIAKNLGNLQNVLRLGLHRSNPDITDTINCTISLNAFNRSTGRGRSVLMDEIPAAFPEPCDHRLEARFITEMFGSLMYYPLSDPELLTSQALSHFKHFNDPALKSEFYAALGYYYFTTHRMTAAMQHLQTALQLSLASGDLVQQSAALLTMSQVEGVIGEHRSAQIHAWEAQKCAKSCGNLNLEARSLFREASVCTALGDYRNTSLLLHKGRELLNQCGLSGGNLDHNMMDRQADVHLFKSEFAEARSIHTEIVQTSTGQYTYMQAIGLLNIAEIDVIIGAAACDVHRNLDNARTMLSTVSFLRGLLYSEMISADLSLRDGDVSRAKTVFYESLNSARGNSNELVMYALERLANGARWTDSTFDWTWSIIYLGYAHKTQQKLDLHKSLSFLANVFHSTGDIETAENLFSVALEGFTFMDVHQGRAECMLYLGDIYKDRGDPEKAVEIWKAARPLFQCSLQAKAVAQIETRLSHVL